MHLHVTSHAISRYRERVAPVDYDSARRALTSPAIVIAAEFGAHYVRLGTGQRVVIEQGAVITVLEGKYQHRPNRRMYPEGAFT